MKHTAISIIFIFAIVFLISPSSSLEFQLISPSSSNVNTSFSVSISSSVPDTYDVKIFVHDDSKEFCEIYYDGKWNNPYYYLKGVFPQTKEYKLRAYYSGATKICARLRKTNSSSFTEVCNPITINPLTNQTVQAPTSNNSASNKTSSDNSANNKTSPDKSENSQDNTNNLNNMTPDFISDVKISESQEQENLSIADNDKIILNKKKEDSKFIARQEKIWVYALYAFIVLLALIIAYFLLRNL